jgi:hypothetical protein
MEITRIRIGLGQCSGTFMRIRGSGVGRFTVRIEIKVKVGWWEDGVAREGEDSFGLEWEGEG